MNPFRPAPGSEPPALVGRAAELAAFQLSIQLTQGGGAAQPVIATGLRRMGKTVLLRRAVREAGFNAIVLSAEGSEHRSLAPAFRRSLERATSELTSIPDRLKLVMTNVIEHLPKASYELPHEMGSIAIEGRSDEHVASKAFIDQIYELNKAARSVGEPARSRTDRRIHSRNGRFGCSGTSYRRRITDEQNAFA